MKKVIFLVILVLLPVNVVADYDPSTDPRLNPSYDPAVFEKEEVKTPIPETPEEEIPWEALYYAGIYFLILAFTYGFLWLLDNRKFKKHVISTDELLYPKCNN